MVHTSKGSKKLFQLEISLGYKLRAQLTLPSGGQSGE